MIQHDQSDTVNKTTWLQSWPTDGLEALAHCPSCGDTSRGVLHSDIFDSTFFCAPGVWKMWSCKTCSAAYLDPRPSPLSIGLAYSRYYTHDQGETKLDYVNLGLVRRVRRQLVNGYTNWRFGTKAEPSHPLGILVAYLLPGMRERLDAEFRSIPNRLPANATVLDLGCGAGAYLEIASRCGWRAIGVDPDPKTVELARRHGLDVREGGIDVFDGQSELFDMITLSHVIEHLHDPIETLEACHRLLKPDGFIWLDTPNIDSYGHKKFGKNWRGLETPRHLVIFNDFSLRRAIRKAGFKQVKRMCDRHVYQGMFGASFAISIGKSPYHALKTPYSVKLQALWAQLLGHLQPSKREFLTFTAKK